MEIIKYVCPIILFFFSVLAVFYACIILSSERMKNLQPLEEAKQEAEPSNRSKSAFLANMSGILRIPV